MIRVVRVRHRRRRVRVQTRPENRGVGAAYRPGDRDHRRSHLGFRPRRLGRCRRHLGRGPRNRPARRARSSHRRRHAAGGLVDCVHSRPRGVRDHRAPGATVVCVHQQRIHAHRVPRGRAGRRATTVPASRVLVAAARLASPLWSRSSDSARISVANPKTCCSSTTTPRTWHLPARSASSRSGSGRSRVLVADLHAWRRALSYAAVFMWTSACRTSARCNFTRTRTSHQPGSISLVEREACRGRGGVMVVVQTFARGDRARAAAGSSRSSRTAVCPYCVADRVDRAGQHHIEDRVQARGEEPGDEAEAERPHREHEDRDAAAETEQRSSRARDGRGGRVAGPARTSACWLGRPATRL